MALAIISVFLVSLAAAFIFAKPMMKFLFRVGIRAVDKQKKGEPLLPTSAGLIAIIGFLAGTFIYIGINTFILKAPANLAFILAGAISVFIITLIGFFDDINVSPKQKNDKGIKDYRIGLKQWQKPLLVLPAAIPLMAVSAGVKTMSIPFVGAVNFGILYPVILIPFIVVFVANATNMLAGMNGLEASLGFLSTVSLGLYATLFGEAESAIISFSAAGSLLAVLFFNWHPAKLLPGDSLTYLTGASMASAIIIGNIEKFGIILLMPWAIEVLLKIRSGFDARSLGNLQSDGTLKPPYKKIYSWTHILMKLGIKKEKDITIAMILIELVFVAAAFYFSTGQATAVI